jgi:seryl-tRNA synthetase
MLDRKFVRNDPEALRKGIKDKGVDFNLDLFYQLDKDRRELIQKSEDLKQSRNIVSKEISQVKKEKKDAADLIEKMKVTSQHIN